MIRLVFVGLALVFFSCNRSVNPNEERIITVSIAPFKYFVESIAGTDFIVNVMVPPGANPHIYEPYPEQIRRLGESEAFIRNGFMAFEEVWLEKFLSVNNKMIMCNIGESVTPIESSHKHAEESEGEHESHHHVEGADPHYWVSPVEASEIAKKVLELVKELNPEATERYTVNYNLLSDSIKMLDNKADSLFRDLDNRTFMIYHPNLGYLARDYNLTEVPVEFEGKEPSPSRMKELIDIALERKISVIFIQKEYDIRIAKAIADQTGSEIFVIDPLSDRWFETTDNIIMALHRSLTSQN